MDQPVRRVVVCYIPGLDSRRISDDLTPTISSLINHYSRVEISTLPNTELVPTLVSGVYPHQNKIWQVSVEDRQTPTKTQQFIDSLPDVLTTTAQCIRQQFDSKFDLAAIPPRRLRDFTLHRFKYTRRAASPEIMSEFNGYSTLFGLLGKRCRYRFTLQFEDLDALVRAVSAESTTFEFVEMYALDLYQHWHLDNEIGMRQALSLTDCFVANLREACLQSGQTLMLLSDHGQEPVRNTIPLVRALRDLGVSQTEYSYFCELACARLWFHTEHARKVIQERLKTLSHCHLLHFSEMHQYHVCFEDARFGEYYLMADPGSIFFPHDFYQPIANFILGLVGHSQRSRMFNPVHRGNHGYLPQHPSEKGFFVCTDETTKPKRSTMSLIDFAPSMLSYLGVDTPPHMTGLSVL